MPLSNENKNLANIFRGKVILINKIHNFYDGWNTISKLVKMEVVFYGFCAEYKIKKISVFLCMYKEQK